MCLGDVVVGTQVIEYDLGRALRNGEFEITSSPKTPARLLLSAVTTLASKHGAAKRSPHATELLRSRLNQYPPPEVPDVLHKADSIHVEYDDTCDYCDPSQIKRQRSQPRNNFLIHHGGVASGDSVNRDVIKRDYLAKKLKVICFEMEAAGIMDRLSCLPIRGICDYSDSHKNKHWQGYAAATAASYARELLETIAPLRKPSRLR